MFELRDLYQEAILDHNKHPRNFHPLAGGKHLEGHNPLCGDRITVYVEEGDGVIKDIGFQGAGCAISIASTSMMTERIKGRPVEEFEALFREFHAMVTGGTIEEGDDTYPLDKLEVFSQVGEYPMRVKCAMLGWHTAKAAIEGQGEAVTIE